MRIININGVWCDQYDIWTNVASSFRKRIPVTDFVVEEDSGVSPREIERLRRFGDAIVRKYDDGTETLLIGHSMGGVTACAIAHRFERTPIRGIVTIFSPHRYLCGWFSKRLGAQEDLRIPIVTFGAWLDPLVIWGTRHPRSLRHRRMLCNHYTHLRDDPRFAELIAEESVEVLFPKA